MAKTNPTIIVARAQHVLVSPRKANLLLEAIVGRRATLVLKQLTLTPQRAADPVAKLIKQAIGNAVSLHSASPRAAHSNALTSVVVVAPSLTSASPPTLL